MASRDSFYFSQAKFVASIPCSECGNNMYCFRRSPVSTGERQWFYCVGCSNEIQRTVGPELGDYAVQAEAERRSGVGRQRSQRRE